MARMPNTRDRMMDVAERLFHRHGFGGVSVEEVTSAVGVKKPDLYNHFRDKNELYTAVRLRRLERLEADLGRVMRQPLPPDDALIAVAAVLLRHPFFLSAPAARHAETFLPETTRDHLFARAYGAVYEPLMDLVLNAPFGVPTGGAPGAVEALLGLCAHFATLGLAEGHGPAERLDTARWIAAVWRNGMPAARYPCDEDTLQGGQPHAYAP